jgi:hypothetical protein
VPESNTSRRSIMFNNPGLAKGTTNTINMGIQMIRPGELAWAHRHSISAIRFIISGDPGISTVVDGVRCAMETGDLILTPQWMWHDHLNQTAKPAIWLDVLDGPVIGMFNQIVFESFGEKQQPVSNATGDAPMAAWILLPVARRGGPALMPAATGAEPARRLHPRLCRSQVRRDAHRRWAAGCIACRKGLPASPPRPARSIRGARRAKPDRRQDPVWKQGDFSRCRTGVGAAETACVVRCRVVFRA